MEPKHKKQEKNYIKAHHNQIAEGKATKIPKHLPNFLFII